jgi:ribonuclease H-related protein
VYVVTAPDRLRGIYASWSECEAAVKGVSGARYQAVASRAQAEAMLRGEGGELPDGLYGFVDGNHLGGVGVVLVERRAGEPEVIEALGMTVVEVFAGAGVASLTSHASIRAALARLRNILAELAALYLLLRTAPGGAALTVVHDYQGVGAWMDGTWRTKDATVGEIIEACRALVRARGLTVRFRHQRGHQSSWAARDDFAHFNARADALATEAARDGGGT